MVNRHSGEAKVVQKDGRQVRTIYNENIETGHVFSESVLNESILCVRSLFISTISVYCACQLGPFTASGHFFYLCTMSVSRVYPMILFSASFQMSPFCVRPMCLSTASSIGGRFAHLQEGSSFYLVMTSR